LRYCVVLYRAIMLARKNYFVSENVLGYGERNGR